MVFAMCTIHARLRPPKKEVKDVVETSVAAKYDMGQVGTMVGGYFTLQAPLAIDVVSGFSYLYPPRPPTPP